MQAHVCVQKIHRESGGVVIKMIELFETVLKALVCPFWLIIDANQEAEE